MRQGTNSATIRSYHLPKLRRLALFCVVAVVAAAFLLTPVAGRSAQDTAKDPGPLPSSPAGDQAALAPPKAAVQSKKSGIEKTKDDAAELSQLADQLRDEVDKLNINVLPLDVLHKTEAVEKLAKKIKAEAHEN